MKSCCHLPGAFLALAAIAVLAGCASTGAPLPPTLALPKPPTDLAATRKGDKVYLSWTQPVRTTDRQSVRHLGITRICRNLEAALRQCDTQVGQVPAVLGDSTGNAKKGQRGEKVGYTDTLETSLERENPLGRVTYAVEVLNQSGRGAGLSNRVEVPAAPVLSPPPDFAGSVTAAGIVLKWTEIPEPHETPVLSHHYRAYRREVSARSWTPVADLPLAGAGEATFVDHGFEWEKRYEYRLAVVTVVSQPNQPEAQVEGDDTTLLRLFAHDVFPPAVPGGLQAVSSGIERQPFVDLIWAPDTEGDLAGYNVYRAEAGSSAVKLNTQPVNTPAYRDSNVVRGKKYSYSVTAIDVRGNESGHSEEADERVP